MKPEEECEASDKDDWQIEIPDGDEIYDIEEASVHDESPHLRNRQRLSFLRGVSRRTRGNFYAIVQKSNSCKITSAMSNQSMVER